MNTGRLSEKTMKIVLGGILVALATVLSMIKVYESPYGGSITLCSMLPVLLYGFKYGVKWGVFMGFVYSVTQFVLGTGAIKGVTPLSALGIILFDYLLAFSLLGVAGIFRNTIKSNTRAFCIGSILAMILRFVCHLISGAIFFGTYAEWYFTQDGMGTMGEWFLNNFHGAGLAWIYSFFYNATYMLPEIVITSVAGSILIKLIEKQFINEKKISKTAS